jgi:uncharacterized repeat protein (TIGR02543 family)
VLTPQRNFVIPAGTTGLVELTAIFDTSPKGFPISYELNGGTNNPLNRVKYFGDNEYFPIAISAPYRLGYEFAGWTAVYSDGTAPVTTPTTTLSIVDGTTGAITLTATWNGPINYNINYNLTGGVNHPNNPATYNIATLPLTINAPSREGYTFQNWIATYANRSSNDLTGSMIPAGTTGEITLRAVWTPRINTEYTVEHYDAVSGAVLRSDILTGTTGSSVVASAVSIAGYTYDPTDSRSVVSGIVAGNGSLVLKLYYTRNPDVEYIVHYYRQGTSTPVAPSETVTAQTMGSTVTVSAKNIDGYAAVLPTSVTAVLNATNNVFTFYYTVTQFTITYELNGGTHSETPNTYTIDDLPLPIALPDKTGYPFLYWVATFSNGSQIQLPTSEIPAGTTGNIRLAAVWSITPTEYSVRYVLNGGDLAPGYPTTYNVQNSITINTNTVGSPTMAGYTFLRWTAVYANGTMFTLTTSGIPTGLIGDVTLVAIWDPTPISYDVIYELAGGVNAPGNPETYTVKSIFPIPVYAPTRAGYEFLYWVITYSNGTQRQLPTSGIIDGTTGNIWLTAVWNPNPISYSIRYDLDGGVPATGNPSIYNVESGAISIASPTKDNYTFQGWMITYDDNTTPTLLSGSVIPAGTTGNILLVAIWEQNP